ncbi:MAG TPA: C1 family peptidase [Pyrinomonadaceae bacterium]|nr:C1 family peptidase [Pyrinomonadaceae bacterium]
MPTRKTPKRKTSSKSSDFKNVGPNLQQDIYAAGHSWTAGPTPVSLLSVNEQRARLGLVVSDAELQATARATQAADDVRALHTGVAAPPPAVDWRNNGGNWTTPVKDQQSCGSCVSFGTLATLEARLNIACQNANLDVDLSEAHLFYCGCGNCCGSGWNFPPALDFCKNNGVGLESSFPYTPNDQPCKAGVPIYVKITNWTSILAIADRKNILATKGPMVAGMEVFQDFYSYTTGVYRHVSGPSLGYHCISVVGYDDNQQCWICKNSWNTTWGDSGFFKIGYGECSIDSQFAFYDIDVSCPAPPQPVDDCARYIPLLKRVLEIARTNRALRLCLRYYICGRGPRPACSAAVIQVVKAVLVILRKCPQYRQPFCRALG